MIDVRFLEQLASARSEIEFKRTAAGFAALQMYDSVKTCGYDPAAHSAGLDRIRNDVSAITSEARIHAALDSLVQVLPFWEASGVIRVGRRAVYTSLLIYGQALSDEGEWRLAQQVYSIVGLDAELDGETWISAEARLMMGRASRMCADWEESRIAYVRAYELGVDAGDFALALRARIGEANNLWSRGDLPAAKQLLNATARRARESCPEILPRITLAIAGIANAAGEYERAIHIAFGLLGSLSDSDELRYMTLVDLAAFLADYGLPDVASAALRIVERGAPEAQIRVHARLNLFFLAARHQDEVEFEVLRLALARDPLTPRQQTQYALFSAQGFRRFAQLQTALSCVEQAIKLANQFQLFQLMFEAESEMQAIEAARKQADEVATQRPDTSKPVLAPVADGTGGSADVIEAILGKSAARETIPPRIRRVVDSLRSMALANVDVNAGRFIQ